jgi:hypothetical protein
MIYDIFMAKYLNSLEEVLALEEGTIIIQIYHRDSSDGSRFDISKKEGRHLVLLEEVGGKKRFNLGERTDILDILYGEKKLILRTAEFWLQNLFG